MRVVVGIFRSFAQGCAPQAAVFSVRMAPSTTSSSCWAACSSFSTWERLMWATASSPSKMRAISSSVGPLVST